MAPGDRQTFDVTLATLELVCLRLREYLRKEGVGVLATWGEGLS